MIRTPFGKASTPIAILPYFFCPKCKKDLNVGDCEHRSDYVAPLWITQYSLWQKGEIKVFGDLLKKFNWFKRHANVSLNNPSFEGNYAGWTTTTANSGSIAIDSNVSVDGVKSSKSTAGATNSTAYASQGFTDISTGTIYVREYFRVSTMAFLGVFKGAFYGGLRGTNNTVNCLSWGQDQNGSGVERFMIRYLYPSSSFAAANVTINANTWYCIEVKAIIAVSGEYRGWLDGIEIITATGLDTSGMPAPDTIRIGLPAINDPASNSSSWSLWCDAVVIDDASYIGSIQNYAFLL